MYLDQVVWKEESENPLKMLTQGQRSCGHVGQHLGVSTFEEGFEMSLGVVSLQALD